MDVFSVEKDDGEKAKCITECTTKFSATTDVFFNLPAFTNIHVLCIQTGNMWPTVTSRNWFSKFDSIYSAFISWKWQNITKKAATSTVDPVVA